MDGNRKKAPQRALFLYDLQKAMELQNQTQYQSLVQSQKKFVSEGKTRSLHFRREQLKILESALLAHEERIYEALFKDLRRPKQEAFISELGPVLEEIRFASKNLSRWMKPEKVSTPLFLLPGKSEILYEPLGSVLIMAPWNYPFQLAISPLIGAMAAGNSVVVKPSEMATHTSRLLSELLSKSFSSEYISVIQGGVAETTELLKEPFDYIFFTGSTKVGKIIAQAAATQLIPTTLELGGKSPAIVTADADLKLAARRLAWGKFMNAGQTCVAPNYIYAEDKIADGLSLLIQQEIQKMYGPHPQRSSSYGRIINQAHFHRLLQLIPRDKIAYGGQFDREDLYLAPTILKNLEWRDPVMQEEIFGPILPILTFDRFESLLETLKKQPKPLSAYLFSCSPSLQERFLSEFSFGGGCINDCVVHLGNPHLPFGGVGASGSGAYHGKQSFQTFSHQKSVVRKSPHLDFQFRYAPYAEHTFQWMRRFLLRGRF